MVELAILRLFSKDISIYNKYKDIFIKTKQDEEIKNLFRLINKYYQRYSEHTHISQDELMLLYHAEYPQHKHRERYEGLITKIFGLDVSRVAVEDLIRRLVSRDYANQLVNLVLPVLSGDEAEMDLDKVKSLITDCESYSCKIETASPFFEDSLDDILNQTHGDGMKWRLSCLQRALGSPTGGTLGHVFARPEAGKTSFLHSITTYFAPQLENEEILLWFNNEEAPARIRLRNMATMSGMTENEMRATPQKAKDIYRQNGGHRIKIVDEAVLSRSYIERMCREYRPRFVVIDQGDKVAVSNSSSMNAPERLKEIYDQLREIVKACNREWLMDMLTVGQADVNAEDKRVLTLGNLDFGKTGKAGAFDYIIGIGYEHAQPEKRFISFPKNKLQGDHSTYAVGFDALRGRYYD